jgi:crossover junction endodeoxyribonuclease RuvC
MRILGIDCGTERTGYGLIESDGRHHCMIDAVVIRSNTADPLGERLACIGGVLRRLLQAFLPDVVAVEEVFHSINAKSALKLAHVRGVTLMLAAEAGLPIAEYSPLSIKMSVTGYGRAEKQQVQLMVRTLLADDSCEFESFDASDALAVAICHATHSAIPAAARNSA